MKQVFGKIVSHRYGIVFLLVVILASISLLTRMSLLIKSFSNVDLTFLNLLGIFIIGFFFDLVNASYFVIPLVLYAWLVPQKIFTKSWHTIIICGAFTFFIFTLLFNAISEWFFWDEFSARFNFIAVDYLVYTTEVIGNIRQSYPIEWIIVAILILSIGFVLLLRPYITLALSSSLHFKKRSVLAVALLALPLFFFFTVNSKLRLFSKNAYVNELSGNGMYELFAAYLNNELDYEQFYKKIDNTEAFEQMHTLLKTKEASFIDNNPVSLERKITSDSVEKKLNVVLISVESLSADFMTAFGNTQNITPNLDSLAQHSLFFTNLYATGTRTVRGLEALSLCIPPTPGQSIVRRPNNEHLSSLGKIFNEKGYESKYIYGGYGYFDNMNYFFANNGYNVRDRKVIDEKEIAYENIWGVADENLFTLAQREIESTIATGKPVFAHVMTTTNHRPFTYPEGRIEIPSHTSREGAVKYTDYAIGRFIKESSKKTWFDHTVFIIVADHCASSAGKTQLPINKYHIPMLIYSPKNVAPGKMDRLMSQIDLGPTLLGLLNFSYTTKFFGYDIFKLEAGRERIFISTYQNLGFIKKDQLIILTPHQKAAAFQIKDFNTSTVEPIKMDEVLLKEAITWYESASYTFKNGLYR
ncbi:MAG TPA: sulfatase-like hydrolase/transferase [Cyclobacteriaceae bacterium]